MMDVSGRSYLNGDKARLGDKAMDLINDTYLGSKGEGFSIAELYLLLGIHAGLLMEAIKVIEEYEDEADSVANPRGRTRRPDRSVQRSSSEVSSETR